MDSSQGMSNDKEAQKEDVVESLGSPKEEMLDSNESMGEEGKGDPVYVQKRLKQQKRAHEREMREMHARMAELQNQLQPNENQSSFQSNPYGNAGTSPSGNVDETIQKAVSFALNQRDLEERKAKDAEARADIANEYQGLQRHLDHMADKYDDFDDSVRGNAPFTATIRDTALLLPKEGPGSAGEVLYKLGKNPEELLRISKLHPHKQAAEVVKLSHALIHGGETKGQSSRPLGQIKNNPVSNSVGVTDKTTPAQIRELMKAGKFK
ncbi:MAG TPA: hypothetical protein VLH77_00275 [Gammaproteobacteria bacterium]|nr:hypothetical protein [Gammaproteobacteria bacterium]